MTEKEKTAKLRIALSDIAEKVREAGKAGYFVNWTPAYRRAQCALKETKEPSASNRRPLLKETPNGN